MNKWRYRFWPYKGGKYEKAVKIFYVIRYSTAFRLIYGLCLVGFVLAFSSFVFIAGSYLLSTLCPAYSTVPQKQYEFTLGLPEIIAGSIGNSSILIDVPIVMPCDAQFTASEAIQTSNAEARLENWIRQEAQGYNLARVNYIYEDTAKNGSCQYHIWYRLDDLSKCKVPEGWPT